MEYLLDWSTLIDDSLSDESCTAGTIGRNILALPKPLGSSTHIRVPEPTSHEAVETTIWNHIKQK